MNFYIEPCCMCDHIIKNNQNYNDTCFWCMRKIIQMAGDFQLQNGKPYIRDDNNYIIKQRDALAE